MRILTVLVLGLVIFSCVRNKTLQNTQSQAQPAQSTMPEASVTRHVIKVDSVIQTSNYSYLKVSESGQENWIAVTRQDAAPGEVYYYENGLKMTNFKSKELNRTFDVIYFVSQLSNDPRITGDQNSAMTQPAHVQTQKRDDIKIDKANGELTIDGLYKNRAQYSGQKVKIKGVVVKVNNGIMGRNWIHIQDGTGDSDHFDLTVTSQDAAKVGDKVTFEGTISLAKDFGAGYFYDVIMENATLLGTNM